MAFLTFRASSSPTIPTVTTVSTTGLTNLQVDGNFASLDSAKYEKTGGAISGDVAITGSLSTSGNSVTINSTNVLVSDNNISIGSVVAVNALSGTISNNAGSGSAWTATVTMTSPSTTAGLIPGTVLTKTTGVGVFGTGAVITSVVSLTQMTISTTTTNTNGALAFNTGSATDLTANGGGITLKSVIDKSIIWDSTNSNWTSSENWNIVTGKEFKINNVSVLNATTLGSVITSSSLTSVGTIATGTWQANLITSTYGGTGYSTYATGDILYSSATNVLSKLARGTDGNILMLVSGVPAWSLPTFSQGITVGTTITGAATSNLSISIPASTGTTRNINITGQTGFSTAGTGGNININGGDAISSTGGVGGTVNITGGNSTAGIGFNGGNVVLAGGTPSPTGTGLQGIVQVSGTNASTSTTTGAFTVAGGVGIAGNLNVGGNLTINGTTTSINSNTLTVDDKNIELGSVATTSPTGNLTAGSAIVTNLSSVVNIIPGSAVTALTGASPVTLPANTTVLSVDSATQITLSAALTGTGTATAATLNISGITDLTANGGGITLKGTTDKTIIWDSTNSNWTSSENLNIATGKVFKINNIQVLSATSVNVDSLNGSTASNLVITISGASTGTTRNINITGQTGFSTAGAGGKINITGGIGGATTAGLGGDVTITGGAATVGSFSGGNVVLAGGAPSGTALQGVVQVSGTNASTSTTTGAFTVVGGVGIQGALYVGSTIDGVTFNSTSDARLKSEIKVIENALDKTLSLNGYTFLLNSDKSKRQTGLLAQEVLKVLPEAVSGTEDTHYSVSYGNVVGLLIEAIKELNTKVTDLQNQLANK